MLNLVLGRSGTGKTEYIRDLLREKAKNGDDRLLLIVPEQFSYSCERAFLETLDPQSAQNIEVLSFTRLADFINRRVGGIGDITLDDAFEVILMLHTINDMQDSLVFYKKQAQRTFFAKDLIILFSEFNKQ
ncbi:MAG: helicase, partial [Clostridia bacterium]|nr:helicase [Clostridia bacterium]